MVALLSGGVGGAKLAEGLAAIVPGGRLSIIGNTGDDLDWFGLRVCPDLDIVMYTLAGLVNRETGWGLAGDSFRVIEMLAGYGQATAFRLGDRDLATALLRTGWLREGVTLTEVTARLSRRLGVGARITPMSDDAVRTRVLTPAGELEFQEYFVTRGARDAVLAVRFEGAERASPSPLAAAALKEAEAVIFAPSNPIVSIGPILAVPGMRELIGGAPAVRIGVSPLIAGQALKGPAAAMMRSLGHRADAVGVAGLYRGLLDVFVIDEADRHLASEIEALGMRVEVRPTVMVDAAGKQALAADILRIAAQGR